MTYLIDGCVQAEARLAVKRAARAEAREIRMKELERQQKEVSFLILSDSVIYDISSDVISSYLPGWGQNL